MQCSKLTGLRVSQYFGAFNIVKPNAKPMDTQTETLENARDEGHQAARDGKMLNENPYPSGSKYYDAWRKAWNKAEKAGSIPEQSSRSGTAEL
jgi:hypothetical protein